MGVFKSRPCTLTPAKEHCDCEMTVYDSALLTFKGVDGYDVYNCSVPFMYRGKRHIFGRVERRDEWVQSNVHLFVETGKDEFTRVTNSLTWNLEDPFIVKIDGQMLFGGTHVTKSAGKVADYCCDFYLGTPDELRYFTSGPATMKDVRLVQLADKRVGVFTHFRTEGSCLTGFIALNDVRELCPEVINSAKLINHRPFGDAWGGVNQAYLLTSGKIGCISHHGYLLDRDNDVQLRIYACTSYVFDPVTFDVHSFKVIGTKGRFPPCEPKLPRLADCAFVSGIVMRDDGKCDLYSGLGDTCEGRITIDYPFEGHGAIADDLIF